MNNSIVAEMVQLTQAAPLTPRPAVPAAELPWYDKIIYDPVNIISISLALTAVILGIIPLFLYIVERQKSKLLDQTVKEFALLDKIREMRAEEDKKKRAKSGKEAED